jgi:copper chaperone CopZ
MHRTISPQNATATCLQLFGMNCRVCAAEVRRELLATPGVLRSRVSLARGIAQIGYDPERLDLQDLLLRLRQARIGVIVDGAGEEGAVS